MVNYQNTAQGLATLGRGGDSTLVHMNPAEVAGLQNLAVQNGTSLTINPNTGMPEAFSLSGLIPMAIGGGLTAATGGAISPLMAGLMVGGATAVMQGDIMAGLGAGLGAYGGGSLAEGFAAAATQQPVGATTTTAMNNAEVVNQGLRNMNPAIAGPSGPGMTGFSSTAGSGTMGISNAANTVTGNYPSAFQNTTNPNSNILGQGNIPKANLQPSSARGYQYTPNEIAGRATDNAIYRDYTGVGGYTPTVQPPVVNAANSNMPSYMNQTGAQQAANNAGITDALSIRDINAVSANNSGLGSISVDSISDNFSRVGEGAKNVITDYSATRDAMGLTDGEMAMKFGLPIAGGIAGGLEESDFQPKGVDMTEFEDNRFRGPEGQLNLSGKTALNLNNPYGYAKGGAVEQGMEAAIARNIGKTYTPPTPVSAPVSAPVAPSNINVGGFTSAPSNLTGALGALNVGSGTIGQSANAIAEAARLKAIEDAKPKTYSGQNVGGSSNTPFSVPTKFIMGQGTVPADYTYGLDNPYYRDIAGNYIRRAQGGLIPAAYAEGGYLGGGDINVQGDGMSDDIPANIDNEQPAALSEGEFVIPADVVSHIGNGSSEAGAKEFYGMMDRVRMARTGRKKQSPEIDPERFMPA
jgi:hypothetical protein